MDKGIVQAASKIIRNDHSALELASNGYTIFPLLNPSDIEQLVAYYHNFQKEEPQHFYSSTHSPDHIFRRESSNFIKGIVAKRIESILDGYQLLGGAFVVKPANGKGLLPPHQDWNIVDERKTRSYNLWIPLTDVTIENGAVYVLEGSHHKLPSYRGPGIPSLFKAIEPYVWKSLRPLPMTAGEALLYDHALLHASPVNQTEKVRLGVVCGIIPQNQSMQLCYGKNGHITSYAVTEDFFLDKDPAQGPEGLERIEELGKMMESMDKDQFDSVFLNRQAKNKTSWFSKLFASGN